jgi:hypothetical protein
MNNVEASAEPVTSNHLEALPEPNMSSGGVGTENDDRK